MDYVDLEYMLQEKMKELNACKMKGAPSLSQSHSPGKGGHKRSKGNGQLPEEFVGLTQDFSAVEYALRCKEAAFLFQLCQQEIR